LNKPASAPILIQFKQRNVDEHDDDDRGTRQIKGIITEKTKEEGKEKNARTIPT
jgi:hypothetical protein